MNAPFILKTIALFLVCFSSSSWADNKFTYNCVGNGTPNPSLATLNADGTIASIVPAPGPDANAIRAAIADTSNKIIILKGTCQLDGDYIHIQRSDLTIKGVKNEKDNMTVLNGLIDQATGNTLAPKLAPTCAQDSVNCLRLPTNAEVPRNNVLLAQTNKNTWINNGFYIGPPTQPSSTFQGELYKNINIQDLQFKYLWRAIMVSASTNSPPNGGCTSYQYFPDGKAENIKVKSNEFKNVSMAMTEIGAAENTTVVDNLFQDGTDTRSSGILFGAFSFFGGAQFDPAFITICLNNNNTVGSFSFGPTKNIDISDNKIINSPFGGLFFALQSNVYIKRNYFEDTWIPLRFFRSNDDALVAHNTLINSISTGIVNDPRVVKKNTFDGVHPCTPATMQDPTRTYCGIAPLNVARALALTNVNYGKISCNDIKNISPTPAVALNGAMSVVGNPSPSSLTPFFTNTTFIGNRFDHSTNLDIELRNINPPGGNAIFDNHFILVPGTSIAVGAAIGTTPATILNANVFEDRDVLCADDEEE